MDSTEEVPAEVEPSVEIDVDLSASSPTPKELEIQADLDEPDGGVLDPPKSILKISTVTQGEEDDHESSENDEKKKDKWVIIIPHCASIN